MKIAVLGSAGSSLPKAPFVNISWADFVQGKIPSAAVAHGQVPGDWDIWGCSPGCWAAIPRATRWFEVHRWEPGQPWFQPEYCQFLRSFNGIVYTGGIIPEITNHQVYPIDKVEAEFSSYFLTSSLALMTALAILEIEKIRKERRTGTATQGALVEELAEKEDREDMIGLWGVDMGASEEYSYQRPGCQFFILEAMRRGIAVYLPPESDLMRPMPVYGISEWYHNYIKLTSKAKELNGRMQQEQAKAAEAAQTIGVLQGELGSLDAFVKTWTSPYGMEHGVVIRQEPGTGLGGGITHLDTRPPNLRVPPPPEPAKE